MYQIKHLNSLSISQKQSFRYQRSVKWHFFCQLDSVFCSMSIEPNWNGGSVEFAINTIYWKVILQRHLWYHYFSLSVSLIRYMRAKLTRLSFFVGSTCKKTLCKYKRVMKISRRSWKLQQAVQYMRSFHFIKF